MLTIASLHQKCWIWNLETNTNQSHYSEMHQGIHFVKILEQIFSKGCFFPLFRPLILKSWLVVSSNFQRLLEHWLVVLGCCCISSIADHIQSLRAHCNISSIRFGSLKKLVFHLGVVRQRKERLARIECLWKKTGLDLMVDQGSKSKRCQRMYQTRQRLLDPARG